MPNAYDLKDLTGAENLALCYAMFRTGMIAEEAFLQAVTLARRNGMTQDDFRRGMQSGLALLHEKGIVHCERDGHRELYPVKLDLNRLTPSALILGDKT